MSAVLHLYPYGGNLENMASENKSTYDDSESWAVRVASPPKNPAKQTALKVKRIAIKVIAPKRTKPNDIQEKMNELSTHELKIEQLNGKIKSNFRVILENWAVEKDIEKMSFWKKCGLVCRAWKQGCKK